MSGTTGTVVTLIVLVLVVGAANVARSALVPSRFHLVFNVGLAAATLVIAGAAGMTAVELGLARADVPRGLRYGSVAFAAVTALVMVAALIPALDDVFDDDRVDIDFRSMLVKALITIPLGTVLVEELIFRGVLLGLLRRLAPTVVAVLVASVLFGLWHVYPAWRSSGDNAALESTGRLSTVLGTLAATTVAGIVFCWLRLRSGSLVAPMLAHIATNSVPFVVAWVLSQRAGRLMPGTLLRGGRLRVDVGGPVVEALGARDGRVVAAGAEDEVRTALDRLGGVDEVHDLGGSWVIPGLVDTHPHLLHFSVAAAGLADLADAADHADVLTAIASVAAARTPGQWVMATPVGEPHYFFRRGYQDLSEGDLPDRYELDRATDRHPVMIQAWSPTMPNSCAFNSLGLAAVGIDHTTLPRVADVWIEKDAAGHPTGRLRGAVTSNYNTDPFFREVLLRLPGPAAELVGPATLAGIGAHHRVGITAVYEPHAMEARHVDVYRRLRDAGRLTMRVKAVPEYQRFTRPNDPVKSLDELAMTLVDALAAVDLGDDWVRAEGITVPICGTCAPGAMLWPTPYLDAFGHETRGRWFVSPEAVDQAASFCARTGLQLNVCSMGPAEHDAFLTAVERHGVRGGVVQHGALMPAAQARRWAAAGFRQTVCPGFTWGKGDVYGRAFGDAVLADLNPLRRLLDAGLTLAASTDWGPKSPWEQLWMAEVHVLGRSGRRNDGPDQVVSRAEALRMWTVGGAAVLDWPELGRLVPGAYADLVVLDRDPLTCALDDLPAVGVLATLTAGQVVSGDLG